MPFITGVAADSHDLLKTLANFVTTGLGASNWSINRGSVDTTISYLDNSDFDDMGVLNHHVSVAMGADDNAFVDSVGWRTSVSVMTPGATIGFQKTTAILPASYRIRGIPYSDPNDAFRNPRDWTLEYSDNGTTWFVSDTVTNETAWSSFEERTFTVTEAVAHTYWRLNITANNGNTTWLELGRLRFYNGASAIISTSYSPEYLLEAPGLSGTESIHLGIRLYEDSSLDYFNWEIQGAIGYSPTALFKNQPQTSDSKGVTLFNSPITYWIVANGQRVIVVAKVSTVYVTMYLGKFTPYGLPAQYPYPVAVAGNVSESLLATRWSVANFTNNCFNLAYQSFDIYTPASAWYPLYNVISEVAYRIADSSAGVIAPTHNNTLGVDGNFFVNVRPAPDGTRPFLPFYLIGVSGENAIFGEMDGVKWVSGVDNAAENLINISGTDWLVVQNVYRTDWRNYFVVELA